MESLQAEIERLYPNVIDVMNFANTQNNKPLDPATLEDGQSIVPLLFNPTKIDPDIHLTWNLDFTNSGALEANGSTLIVKDKSKIVPGLEEDVTAVIEKNGYVYRIGLMVTFGVESNKPLIEWHDNEYPHDIIKENQPIQFKINPRIVDEKIPLDSVFVTLNDQPLEVTKENEEYKVVIPKFTGDAELKIEIKKGYHSTWSTTMLHYYDIPETDATNIAFNIDDLTNTENQPGLVK